MMTDLLSSDIMGEQGGNPMGRVIDSDQKIKLAILDASLYWRETLTNEAIVSYFQELRDLPAENVVEAFRLIKRDPKQTRMPLPSVVRARMKPELDEMDLARMTAGRIIEMVSRVGPYRTPDFSPVETMVVRCIGGWQNLCETLDNRNMNQMMAQLRDLALSFIKQERGGHLTTEQQAIPQGSEAQLLGGLSVAGLLQKIPK